MFISKHCFYSEDEGSKSALLDMEWGLTFFEGVLKGEKVYSFKGDMFYEDYLLLLDKYFSVKSIVDAPLYMGYPLSKIGDTLDSKIVICLKK